LLGVFGFGFENVLLVDLFGLEAYGIRGRVTTSILPAERRLPVVDSGMQESDSRENEEWIYGRDLPVLSKSIKQPVHDAWGVDASRASKVVLDGLG
jgi:hypothetical protein